MSFATLEEAWGVPNFTANPPPLRAAEAAAAGRRRQRQRGPKRDQRGSGAGFGLPAGSRGRGAVEFAPAPQLTPQREDEAVELQNARKLLARTYARYGAAGVARLLPREAAEDLQLGLDRKAGGAALWTKIVRFMSCPEKMLFVLLCAFALLVLWDTWSTQSAAHTAATLASLHMAPFPSTTVAAAAI